MILCTKAMWSTSVEVYCLSRSSLFTRTLNSFGLLTKYLQGSSIPPPWTQTPSGAPQAIWAFIVIMNFEPELLYCFYCISVLIYFIAVVFELGIFGVIDEFLAKTLILRSLRFAVLKRIAVRKPFISRSNGMGCRSNGLSYPFKNN